jgi:hypothetical protein
MNRTHDNWQEITEDYNDGLSTEQEVRQFITDARNAVSDVPSYVMRSADDMDAEQQGGKAA